MRMALSYICQKAKTNVVLVGCFSQQHELRWLPYMDIGRPPLIVPYRTNGRIYEIDRHCILVWCTKRID
jgi:hypothetical protein